MMILDELSELP